MESAELQILARQLAEAAETFSQSEGQEALKSRLEIISKAKQIATLTLTPDELSLQHSSSMAELVAIRSLMKMRVLENIPFESSISLQELSQKTGAQDSLLERILRMAVVTAFLQQTESGEYEQTRFSQAYLSMPGIYFRLMYDEFLQSMVNFHDYLDARGNLDEPSSLTMNPYSWRHNQDGKTTWEIMAQYPERMKAFQLGLDSQNVAFPVVGLYDFGKLNTTDSRPILVDVGGGQGHSIVKILDHHKNLAAEKMILQDLPEVIELAKTFETLPKGVVKMEHDFFREQPVKGAKAYLLRRVLHDYADDNCIQILRHLAAAMSQDSVLLISDMVVPAKCSETDILTALMDIAMMGMGGKEKTEENFVKILAASGLKLVKIWRAAVGPQAVVEACLANKS